MKSEKYYTDPETQKEYPIVDGGEYSNKLLKEGHSTIYAEKCTCVLIRPTVPGEQLVVRKDDGTIESIEVQREGCWVALSVDLDRKPILNSDGSINEYQMEDDKLKKRYDIVDIEEGFAKPKGGIQKFVQVEDDIAIMVPWGENGALVPLKVDAGSYLNITDPKDIYGVDAPIFEKTYAKVSLEKVAANDKDKNIGIDK